MKENQELKYFNRGSCHTHIYVNVISTGVFSILCKFTSRMKENMNTNIGILYPDHINDDIEEYKAKEAL